MRTCTICGKSNLTKGYCIDNGLEYYCTDECLHQVYTKEAWEEMYKDGGDNYWTEWEEIDMLENLSREELIKLLLAYDLYIKGIVEDLPLHMIDRVPVSINEFFYNDFEYYRGLE